MATITQNGCDYVVEGPKATLDVIESFDADTGVVYEVCLQLGERVGDNIVYRHEHKDMAIDWAEDVCDNGWKDEDEIDTYIAQCQAKQDAKGKKES